MIAQKNSSCNKNLIPAVFTTVKNALVTLSISTDPTIDTNAPTLVPSLVALARDDKTIIPPGPREHHRQQKIARCQHIKQTLQWLCNSDDPFLDNSIPHTKDKCTTIAKGNTNNATRVAINSAHAQREQPTMGLTQCGPNMAYRLGSAFNWTIKKLNRNKHVNFAKQNEVHLYDTTATPSIMLTYDSRANGHFISKQDQCKVGLPVL